MLSPGYTHHLGTSSVETNSPFKNLEFSDEESFCSWLKTESEIVEWNLIQTRSAPKSGSKLSERTIGATSKRGRPLTAEWTKYFQCPFGGSPRPRPEGSSERTTYRPTRKVGCLAKIKVQKLFSSHKVFVTYLNSHSGHGIDDLQTWTSTRMSSATRNWLEKAVASGIEWKDLKRITQNEAEKADFLAGENGENYGPLEVSDILRIKNQDFNNFRRKYLAQSARLHPDCRQSESKYAEVVTQAGEFSTPHDFQEDKVADSARLQVSGEKSLPDPTVKLSTEPEARHESDNLVKASFWEQVEFAKSYINSSSRLNDEERDALKTISSQLARLKRDRDSIDRSCSKRQCS